MAGDLHVCRIIYESTVGVIERDTRSVDYIDPKLSPKAFIAHMGFGFLKSRRKLWGFISGR